MLVVAVQTAAALNYAYEMDWKQSTVWLGVAISNIAWLMVHRS